MESCKFRNHSVGPKTYRMDHPVFVSSPGSSESSNGRASDPIERSTPRSSDRRLSDRPIERALERSSDRAIEASLERSCDKDQIKTRAPEVRLTRQLVHSTYFFKTKRSNILPMLKTDEKEQFRADRCS